MQLIPAFLLAFALPFAAHAQVIGDPEVIAFLMQEKGLDVEITTDREGDPLLSSRMEATNFQVYFYDCEVRCTSIQFSAGFDMPSGMTLERVNEWNRNYRYGKVYLDDEDDPYIELDVNLDAGGVVKENFEDTVDMWGVVLKQFKNHIDW